jgi:hypothetical protein
MESFVSGPKGDEADKQRRRRRKGEKGSGRQVLTKGNNLGSGSSNDLGLVGGGTPGRANLPTGSRTDFCDIASKRSGDQLRTGTERPTGGGIGSTFDSGLGGVLDNKLSRTRARPDGKPVGIFQEFGDSEFTPPANGFPEQGGLSNEEFPHRDTSIFLLG